MSNINEKISKDNNQSEILKYKEQEKANEDDTTFDAFESKILNSDVISNSDKKSSLTTENQGWIQDTSNDEPKNEESTEKTRIKNRRMILGLVYGGMFIICLITVILIKMKYDYDHEILQEPVQNGKDLLAVSDINTGQINEVTGYEDGFYTKDVYNENGEFIYRTKYRYVNLNTNDEKLSYYGKDTVVGEDENAVINYVFDSDGRISREVSAKGEIREYSYEGDNSNWKTIHYSYPDGAVETEYYDGYGHCVSSRVDYLDGSYKLTQYNKNSNRYSVSYNSSDLITSISYYYEPYTETWNFDEKGTKPVSFDFYDKMSSFHVNLAGDGKITRKTLTDGSKVTIFSDSELIYRLTENADGNQKREIADRDRACLFTVYLWNTKDAWVVTQYYDSENKENWRYNYNTWMVNFVGGYMRYGSADSNYTKESVNFNEEEEYCEVVSVDSVIAKTGTDNSKIERYFANGIERFEILSGKKVNEKWEPLYSEDRIRDNSFPGNDEYDDKAIFKFFED